MKPRVPVLLGVMIGMALSLQVHAKDILIQNGYVMTMDPSIGDIEGADVHVRDGKIVAVGKNLDPEGADRISAHGAIVLPGFVDTHSHLYVTTMRGQFRNAEGQFFPVSSKLAAKMTPDDVHAAMYTGALELIDAGITTTADFFDNVLTPAHGDAGLRALEESGIRATMYYGGPDKTTKRPIDLEQLRKLAKQQNDANSSERVRIGIAWRLPRDRNSAANWAMRQQEFDTAKALGLPIQVHVSGEPEPMFDALIKRHYLSPQLTVVHATDARPDQLQALEKAEAGLALTPISEHRVGYGLTELKHFASVSRQGLGIDGNSLAGSADMFASMRLAALTWSGVDRNEKAPSPRELLELATGRGATAIGMGEQIGSLTVGKRADLQIVKLDSLNLSGFGGGDPAALLVYSARPSDVDTVIVDGRVLKRDGKLVGVDTPEVLRRAEASARALLAP